MLYVNQLDYPDLRYPTNAERPETDAFTKGTVKTSGCGLCSAVMLADRLTDQPLTLEDALALSLSVGANHEPGTDMKVLGPALAERLDLRMTVSDDIEDLEDCLRLGGACIVNVGGNREGHTGIFSHVGHFMLIVSCADGLFRILDPSKTDEKYRDAPVIVRGNSVYASAEAILEDTANRSPAFYLFNNRL